MRRGHLGLGAVLVVVLLLAGAGLWQAGGDRSLSLEERTTAVAAQLRCPTCQAQSVAMSHSDIAASMQVEIRSQLAAGRTAEQVRVWFADRYGPDVLLDPPRTGVGLWLWLVPGAMFVGGLLVLVLVVRRRGWTPEVGGAGGRVRFAIPVAAVVLAGIGVAGWQAAQTGAPDPPAVAEGVPSREVAGSERAVATAPADPGAWVALGAALEADRAYGRAADAYRSAVELQPGDVRARVRLGLVLLKADDPAQAEEVARQILAERPDHPEGLLVLGLAQRARDLPDARATLQRFLDLAPEHPAAAEVRRLIA